MQDQSWPCIMAFAAAILLLAFGSAYAGERLPSDRDQAPEAEPFYVAPPPFRLIHCAGVLGGSPCEPDSAMRGMGRQQHPAAPPMIPDLTKPDFAPAR